MVRTKEDKFTTIHYNIQGWHKVVQKMTFIIRKRP